MTCTLPTDAFARIDAAEARFADELPDLLDQARSFHDDPADVVAEFDTATYARRSVFTLMRQAVDILTAHPEARYVDLVNSAPAGHHFEHGLVCFYLESIFDEHGVSIATAEGCDIPCMTGEGVHLLAPYFTDDYDYEVIDLSLVAAAINDLPQGTVTAGEGE